MHPVPRLRTAWLLLAGLLVPVLVSGCGTTPATDPAPAASSSGSQASPGPSAATPAAGNASCEYVAGGAAAKPVDLPSTSGVPTRGKVSYELTMTEGKVAITLDRAKAPCTAHSFESLVAQGFYDQTRCHRLADSGIFVLQCGDPTGTGSGGPGYTYADETDGTERYAAGAVAMANAGPNTNGSQFFLVWDDTDLEPNYTIFARMDGASRDVVARMAAEGQDGSNPDGTGKPNNPAEILSVRRR